MRTLVKQCLILYFLSNIDFSIKTNIKYYDCTKLRLKIIIKLKKLTNNNYLIRKYILKRY